MSCAVVEKKSFVEDDPRLCGGRRGAVFLENAQEVLLFLVGLEAAVAELGSRIDQGQPDLFGGGPLGLREERLADVEDALPDADARALEHDEVLLHHTVVRETAHRVDRLLRDVLLRHGVVGNQLAVLHVESVSDAVDLLVDLRAVMITLLSDAGDRIGDSGRMPGADASHFAKTLVRLARQLLHVPTGDDTFDSVTLGDADDVDHLVLGEDVLDRDRLLHQTAGVVNLLRDRPSVQLNLVDMRLLLPLAEQLDLRVGDDADNGAVLLHLSEILFDLLLSVLGGPLLRVLGEGLLLGRVPILVESASDFLGEMLGPDGLESPHAVRRLDVADDADDHDGRGLDDGHRLDHFLLVRLGSGPIHQTANMRHTGLVTGEGGKMNRLLRVILGEGLDSAFVVLASLLGQESQVAVTRRGEFTVRHLERVSSQPPSLLYTSLTANF